MAATVVGDGGGGGGGDDGRKEWRGVGRKWWRWCVVVAMVVESGGRLLVGCEC